MLISDYIKLRDLEDALIDRPWSHIDSPVSNSFKDLCFVTNKKQSVSFIPLGVPIVSDFNFSVPVYYSNAFAVLKSSWYLYEKSIEYFNNTFLFLPNQINILNREVSDIELKLSSVLSLLSKQEDKWISLSNFAEEYKRELEITDEELWHEHGNELRTILYEIQSINLTKTIIYETQDYVERTKKILYHLSTRIKSYHLCDFRHQIAFSTKNLDDEHNFRVKIGYNQCFTHSEIAHHEKKTYNKPFTISFEKGFAEGTESCNPRSN